MKSLFEALTDDVKKRLKINNKKIKNGKLPEISDIVTHVICDNTDIESLVGLPSGLKILSATGSALEGDLTGLPEGVDDVDVSDTLLSSLKGCPSNIRDQLLVNDCNLTSLKHAPKFVGQLYASDNPLEKLECAHTEIGEGGFDVSSCGLTSLKHGPTKVEGTYSASYNKLESLDGLKILAKALSVSHNKISSLTNCRLHLGHGLILSHNELESLSGIEKNISHCVYINLENNPLKSHLLGLLKVKGLKRLALSDKKLEKIIVKHLGGSIDDCKKELEENGYEEFAQL